MWAKPHHPSRLRIMQLRRDGGDHALLHCRGSSVQQPGATLLEGAQGAPARGQTFPTPLGSPEQPGSCTEQHQSWRWEWEGLSSQVQWEVAGLTLAPEHCHGCLSPVNTPGVVADLHCKAAHKAPVRSDSGPDPAVPGGTAPAPAGTSSAGGRVTVRAPAEVCAVTARLALWCTCFAVPALLWAAQAVLLPWHPSPVQGWRAAEGWGSALGWPGCEEAARGRSAPSLPQAGLLFTSRYGSSSFFLCLIYFPY